MNTTPAANSQGFENHSDQVCSEASEQEVETVVFKNIQVLIEQELPDPNDKQGLEPLAVPASTIEKPLTAIQARQFGELLAKVLIDSGVNQRCEVSLSFISPKTITELNSQYMGKDTATDVLAFPIDLVALADLDNAEASEQHHSFLAKPTSQEDLLVPLSGGDVVVCCEIAAQAAQPVAQEVACLVVHAGLHLLGYDHDEPKACEKMQRLQDELLGKHWPSAQSVKLQSAKESQSRHGD